MQAGFSSLKIKIMVYENKRLLIILLSVVAMLLIPAIAMQFTNEVLWTRADFLGAGFLLFGTGALLELVLRKVRSSKFKLMLVVVLLFGLVLIWAELAVGIFDSQLPETKVNAPNTDIDLYLEEGCGRCAKHKTPDCNSQRWNSSLVKLRKILLESGMKEERKWSVPCYTVNGQNVLILHAFNDFASLNFFKGVLIKDDANVLVAAGENSQSARQWRFANEEEIAENEDLIKAYIHEAMENEKAGKKVKFKKIEEQPIPEEFRVKLNEDESLKLAFEALTPGRQRGYLLYFAQPKQSKTKVARIEKCIPKILDGQGLHDEYRNC